MACRGSPAADAKKTTAVDRLRQTQNPGLPWIACGRREIVPVLILFPSRDPIILYALIFPCSISYFSPRCHARLHLLRLDGARHRLRTFRKLLAFLPVPPPFPRRIFSLGLQVKFVTVQTRATPTFPSVFIVSLPTAGAGAPAVRACYTIERAFGA